MTEVSTIRNAINKLVYETYWGDSFDASNSAYMQLFKMLGESLDFLRQIMIYVLNMSFGTSHY